MFGHQNKFLNDFIMSQNKLVHSEADKKDKKGRTKSRHGTASGKKEPSGGDEFALLCNEKPAKAKVLEYFKDRIAELTAEEMEK